MSPKTTTTGTAPATSAEAWPVFVVFDDPAAQQQASCVCDYITKRFWPEIEFELQWCALNLLGAPEAARQAIEGATNARLVIFATSARAEWPPEVVAWLNEWCARRRGREGALIGLIDATAEAGVRERMDQLLRCAAHRAGLDYLTRAPECGLTPMPDEAGWLDAKAQEVGPVLDGILTKPMPPPRLHFAE